MRLTSLLFLALCTQVHAERFFGTIQIGEYEAHAVPTEHGAGGFWAKATPVYADAVVNVDEGQSITWEWMRIVADKNAVDEDNLSLTVNVPPRYFQDVKVDLNPARNNIWMSSATFLEFNSLEVFGDYRSFSYTSEFTEWFHPTEDSLGVNQGRYGFKVPVTLDYTQYPHSLRARVSSSWEPEGARFAYPRTLNPRQPVLLEPELLLHEIYMRGASAEATLHYTPAGDANSDGQVNFQDFVILASGFGLPGSWDDGDFDADGLVGFSDFTALANEYQQPMPSQSVPEPCLWLWMPVVLCMIWKRMKK